MRTAIFSDVHGNAFALHAMLRDLEERPADQLVCLGDALQGGAQPRECADLLRDLGCPVVIGNADAFVLTLESGFETPTDEQLEVAHWTREQLGEGGLGLIRTFRPTVELELGGGHTLLAFHGSPRSYDELLFPSTPEDDVRAALDGVDADIVAGGHIHMQWTRPIAHRLLLNPGSVGLAYDHEREPPPHFDPWAQYAVISSDERRLDVELRRVAFDPDAVAAAAEASGRPHAESYAAGWRAA